jgi:YidC/Oxa1 family membrane protein insertase
MGALFQTLIQQPILNLLIWLYDVLPGNDIGLAIIALTILVKLVLYPFAAAQIKQQRALQRLQPKIDEVRERLKDDKEKQAKELMELYKQENVNPAASCLPLLIQLPVFIGLFHALREGLASRGLDMLYAFVPNPGTIDPFFLGVLDLSKPNIVLAVVAGAVQFIQTRQILAKPSPAAPPPAEVEGKDAAKDESMAALMNKQMAYIAPAMTIFFGINLPGGMSLYWIVMGLLTVAQQAIFLRKPEPPVVAPQLS